MHLVMEEGSSSLKRTSEEAIGGDDTPHCTASKQAKFTPSDSQPETSTGEQNRNNNYSREDFESQNTGTLEYELDGSENVLWSLETEAVSECDNTQRDSEGLPPCVANECSPETTNGQLSQENEGFGRRSPGGNYAQECLQPMNENNKELSENHTPKQNTMDIPSLNKIESVKKDAELVASIIPGMDMSLLYEQIKARRNERNRVEIVTNLALEGSLKNMPTTDEEEEEKDPLLRDLKEVMSYCPHVDPNVVYAHLEKRSAEKDRVKWVVNDLLPKEVKNSPANPSRTDPSSGISEKNNSLFSNPEFRKNPLYNDVKALHKVLPDRDPNEIYAYLEAHFDRQDRVKIVLEELTRGEPDSQEEVLGRRESFDAADADKGKAPLSAVLCDTMQVEVEELKEIFPDCDPNYLYQKLEDYSQQKDRVNKIAADMFEHRNYPKLKDVLEKQEKLAQKHRYERLEFNMKDFLDKFPNPLEFFYEEEKAVSQSYKEHVLVYMKNTYPMLKDGFIKKVLENHSYHLTPALVELDGQLPGLTGKNRSSKKLRKEARTAELPYPENPDDLFFHEVWYCQHEQDIRKQLEEEKRLRELKIEEARKTGQLHECGCCFDDECLFDDMLACADGHLFCKECIVRSTEAAVGVGKIEFMCLTGTCEHQFPLASLQEVLPPNMFSIVLRKMQEEEIKKADIPDLVCCPFCSFATIMSNPHDKVFKCLNPECLKDSCRLCKEPNHIPLRCDEVEKQGEASMRAYIETKMSEAMLRICPKCKKRFYKIEGCNKMTCTCGTTMCYVCREANIDYDHFDGRTECSNVNNMDDLHKREMEKAAADAKQQYLQEHPEASDIELKYDPLKLVKNAQSRQYGMGLDYDDGDDDEEEEMEYDEDDDYY